MSNCQGECPEQVKYVHATFLHVTLTVEFFRSSLELLLGTVVEYISALLIKTIRFMCSTTRYKGKTFTPFLW